jgi:tripartite-type tricarboxylate transporter receptor subunit TctC
MRRAILAVAAICGLCGLASAQAWPTKPLRIVVPWPAGGSADLIGRMLGDHLSDALKQPVLVENRPGASGMLGSAAVANADPDGSTFLISGIPSHVIAPATAASAGFDPLRDFTHIAYVGGSPIVVSAHTSLGVTSFADLVATVRRAGGTTSYVSPGVGSLGHMVGEYLARKDHVPLKHVPYKGGMQAVTDLIAGHVKVGIMTWTTSVPHIRSGKLAGLASSATARSPRLPDLPTLTELGYGDLVTNTWWAFSGPARLQSDVVARLNRDINQDLATERMRQKLAQEEIESEMMSSEQFTGFVAREIAKWGPLARAALSPAKSER